MVHSRTWTIEIRISEHKREDEQEGASSDKGVRGTDEELAIARETAALISAQTD